MLERLEKMPVPVLPTFVGALTLSNVYNGLGFAWIRHLMMWTATIILLVYIVKIIKYPKVCLNEYKNTVPCSLYAAFDMIMMILGSYYFVYNAVIGKALWMAGIIIHACHICIFTYRNVIKERNVNTFVPSWFVTYNGIMVSCVVGGSMNAAGLLQYIVYYGIAIYFLIIPIMIWRLIKVEVKAPVYHTMAVVLAPCSLCIVSYLNVIQSPNAGMVYVLYACVLASLAFIIIKLPNFFAFQFVPGFAGLTFPMAIGIVASQKMAGYLSASGNEALAGIITQISGFQIFLTTMIIGYVLLNFVIMALRIERK